jgi:cell division septum initiation protein DivIVA
MTKAEELTILDSAINKLGADSYLGPWLNEIRNEVEGLIRADLFPHLSLDAARKNAAETREDARRDAEAIINSAKVKAESIEDHARRLSGEIRQRCAHLLRESLDSLKV